MPSGRLLIVDDEASLVKLMSEYLRRLGYTVEARQNAGDALSLLRSGAEFDVLVVDYSLPDMTGEELMLQALDMAPGLKALVCSGYIYVPEKLPPETRKRVSFLLKPFVPKMLAKEVEKLVGG